MIFEHIANMSSLPVLGELRLQVLVFGVEELDEVCRLRDPRVAAQKLVTILLQELEAHQWLGGAPPLPAAPRLLVWKHTGRVKSGSGQPVAAHRGSLEITRNVPRNLGMTLSDFFSLLAGGKAFFSCFCNKEVQSCYWKPTTTCARTR